MSPKDRAANPGEAKPSGAKPSVDEISTQIRRLQQEIDEREQRIMELVDTFEPPAALETLAQQSDTPRMARHLARLIVDWENLLAHSHAVSEDDDELLVALVPLVGDLILPQPEGIDERFIFHLKGYLETERAKIS